MSVRRCLHCAARPTCTKIHASVRAALPPPALPEKSVFRRELPQDLVAFSSRAGRSLLADATPLTPRTPQEIKAEFERRQDERSGESDLEGVEWAINKIRTTYLFGFFEGACFFCFAFFIMLENVCRRSIASHVSPSQAPRARRPRPSSTRCSPSRS